MRAVIASIVGLAGLGLTALGTWAMATGETYQYTCSTSSGLWGFFVALLGVPMFIGAAWAAWDEYR